MDLEWIRNQMKLVLSEKRYLHSIGVEEVSCDLALLHGYDMKKASVAGILHDCAKCLSVQELLGECKKYQLPISEVEHRNIFLLHAKVGAMHAKVKYNIEEVEILNAINYHTTGRPAMTLLEKIIFTADYIEPYRKQLPRLEEIRRLAFSDLDFAVYMILENVLRHLKDSGEDIDTLTEETYRYYGKLLQLH